MTKSSEKNKGRARTFEGTITITPGGFGFVYVEDGEVSDIFIPPQFLNGAIHDDLVLVKELPPNPRFEDRGPAGEVLKVLERRKTTVVGELIAGRKVKPLSGRYPFQIMVSGRTGKAKKGDWVELELFPYSGKTTDQIRGKVISSLGRVGNIEADLDAVAKEYGLQPIYTREENARVMQVEPAACEREDLTELYCVTIDPEDAKDFDDSVSIRRTEKKNRVELGVHIADVSAWIPPGSEWDVKAEERGFTAYLPGRTLPMLPPSLTAASSLREGVTSLAHSFLITVDTKKGKVVSSRRCFSSIRVRKRLDFDSVEAFTRNEAPNDWSEELSNALHGLTELYRTMRKYRKSAEEFLELETETVRVLIDESTDRITGLKTDKQREAEKMVEEFMLAANVAAATELSSRKIPGLYRIHPPPSDDKIQEFTVFMQDTFGLTPGDISSRKACNRFLSSLKDDHTKPIIIDAFLRSLMRAGYSEKQALHFGLGKGLYSHFTSPIRRYSDLAVHQQLRALENPDFRKRNLKEMRRIAAECTELERTVDEAFYAANDRMKLHYLKDQLMGGHMDFHEAVISKVSSSGLLAALPELGITGFVPAESIGRDMRRRRGRLVSRKGKKRYSCGDIIYLQLERIDMIRGKAIFRPVK